MKIKLLFSILALIFFVSFKSSAQELSMYPGFWKMQYYQDSEKISKGEFENLILQDVKSAELWNKSKKQMAYGLGAFGVQLGFFAWQIVRRNDGESQTLPVVGGLASAGVAIAFILSSNNSKKKAILQYNDSKDTGVINIGPTYNGMGLVLSF